MRSGIPHSIFRLFCSREHILLRLSFRLFAEEADDRERLLQGSEMPTLQVPWPRWVASGACERLRVGATLRSSEATPCASLVWLPRLVGS
jgi:hypothetical protein